MVGRDLVGVVEEAQAQVARVVQLPPGYNIKWSRQFERTKSHGPTCYVFPFNAEVIVLLSLLTFGDFRQAVLIILVIPFAMVGRLTALKVGGLYYLYRRLSVLVP